MNITHLAVRRPVTILMLVLFLVVLGGVSYGFLPVRELPSMPQPTIVVSTEYVGASPADVRRLVTDPLENGLELVNGIASMSSISSEGESQIKLQFASAISPDTAATDVEEAIHRVTKRLPRDASLPTIIQRNPSDIPIMLMTMNGKLSSGQLAQYANENLLPKLQSVPGIAGITITGASIPQIDVTVDPERMAAYRLSITSISKALTSQNVGVPGGTLQNGEHSYMTSTNSSFTTADSLKRLMVGSVRVPGGDSVPIALGQVADISQSMAGTETMTSENGNTAIGISIGVQNGANSLEAEQGVLKALKQLRKGFPPGIHLNIVSDLTLETRAALHAVFTDLLIAIGLTSIILYIFLRRLAHTFIVLLAIPTSLISTFTVMYALHFSLDLMSLLGLSLLIGILVDDSIVVLENIDRHLERGVAPREAAVKGRMEIGAAAVAITLTDVVVYAPVAFVHGTVGQLFREFGLTIVAATLFSLFVSFTLTPMLASRWLRKVHTKNQSPTQLSLDLRSEPDLPIVNPPEGAAQRKRSTAPVSRFSLYYQRLLDGYGLLIGKSLDRRIWIVGIAGICLVCSLLFVPLGWVHTAFLPDANPNLLQVDVSLPPSTSLQKSDTLVRHYVTRLQEKLPSSNIYAVTGQAGDGTVASNAATVSIVRPVHDLHPSAGEMSAAARQLADDMPGMIVRTEMPNPLVSAGIPPVDIVVTGPDPGILRKFAADAAQRIRQVPGLTEIRNAGSEITSEYDIHLDAQKAERFHLTTAQVGAAVQQAVQGNVVTTLSGTGQSLSENVFVSLKNGKQLNNAQIQAIPVANLKDRAVRLGDVAEVSLEPGPTQLSEMNNLLAVHITANIQGITTGQANQRVTAALSSLGLPNGYAVRSGGQIADQQMAFAPLTQAFVLSVILVYMLMAALYESFVTPMVVLLSLPLATVGAFAGLLATGQSLNIFSFIAMIMLMGLVAKNAILLVDFANTLLKNGSDRRSALIQAGKTRIRPILMTTATMIISMLPLALDRGVGAADRVPVAVVLICGMLSSTLLTLIVVPVLFTYLDDLRLWISGSRALKRIASMRERGVDAP